MRTIISRSIPLKDVIADIAAQMGVEVVQRCDDYSLKVPTAWGSGYLRGINFQGGLGLFIYECYFNKDVEIHFILDHVHPLKFLFCEKGGLAHRFENELQFHEIDALQNMIVASCDSNGHILQFKANTLVKLNSLEINRKQFESVMDCELSTLHKSMQAVFRDIGAKNMFYYHGNYSLKMANLFLEIDNSEEKDFLERIFMEGAAFKILLLQILQYTDDLKDPENKSILRKSEMILVQEASEIINNEILDYKGVSELALLVGLNANKLQNGFKELYETTVNGYVQDRRLDLATNLLKSSDLTISEIVYIIGLSSKSYFSKVFKDKYGTSPSYIRKIRKTALNKTVTN